MGISFVGDSFVAAIMMFLKSLEGCSSLRLDKCEDTIQSRNEVNPSIQGLKLLKIFEVKPQGDGDEIYD